MMMVDYDEDDQHGFDEENSCIGNNCLSVPFDEYSTIRQNDDDMMVMA